MLQLVVVTVVIVFIPWFVVYSVSHVSMSPSGIAGFPVEMDDVDVPLYRSIRGIFRNLSKTLEDNFARWLQTPRQRGGLREAVTGGETTLWPRRMANHCDAPPSNPTLSLEVAASARLPWVNRCRIHLT